MGSRRDGTREAAASTGPVGYPRNVMPLLRRVWREVTASGVAVFVLAIFVGSVGPAYAAAPFSTTPYDGASAGSRYTVDLTPGCSDPNMGRYCTGTAGAYVPPTSLSIQLYTHHRAGSQCASKGYAFNPATISAGGSFSTKASFSTGSPPLTFTVSGTFVSASRVHGTIVGNYGCGTSSFTINLHPRPLISTAPCQMMTDVHAAKTIFGGQPVAYINTQDSFSPQGGECSLEVGRGTGGLQFIVAGTPAQLGSGIAAQDGRAFQVHQALPGLGAGATLYFNHKYSPTKVVKGTVVPGKPTAAILDFEVDFRLSGAWASISVSRFGTGCECFEPSQFAVEKRHLLAAARALRPLLH